MIGDKLLEIKNLQVQYMTEEKIVHAVNSLDLSINSGESLGLVGETGAGKTTTALSVLKLLSDPPGKIIDGDIYFEGENILNSKVEHLRHIRGNEISMIFQDPMTSLNPVYSVGEQIAEVIKLHENYPKLELRKKAEEMLEMVGIPKDRYDEYPHQFSGGMKQRVVIAMSIACSPKLILADEPTTALDVTIQAQVLELMNKLKSELNTSLLLITHDLGVVAQVCDKVAIMYAGEIVEQGSVTEIFEHPSHPYTMGLFDSIPSLDKKVDKLIPIKGEMPDPTNLPTGCSFHPRCKYINEGCRKINVEMSKIGDTHFVRCLYHEGKIESKEFMEVLEIER